MKLYAQILKWDRNQPRGPKGSPEGGRWVKGVSAGLGDVPYAGGPQTVAAGYASVTPGMERGPNIAEAAFPPQGTGFVNQPRGKDVAVMASRARAAIGSEGTLKVLEALQNEDITDATRIGGSSNSIYRVTLESGVEAAYKPEAGETWKASFSNGDISRYVTNKNFSLAEREAFAYEVGNQLFGADNPVPVTVLREHVEAEGIDSSSEDDEDYGYDSEYYRELYEEEREKLVDKAYEAVGEEFGALYDKAADDHVDDINNRAEELQALWDEEKKSFTDITSYGSVSILRGHPALPLGSKTPFERKGVLEDEVDPLEVLKDAEVDVSASMNNDEEDRVRGILRERLAAGYRQVADVDDDAAREDLDRDQWYQEHADTENRLMESKIQSFDSWMQSHGHGGGGGGQKHNAEAPHPNGGSLQHWGGNEDGTLSNEDGARMAVLDYAIGTMDRHDHNVLFDDDDRVIAIDNGYSMPEPKGGPHSFTFRSSPVMEWKSSGAKISDSQRLVVSHALEQTNWTALLARHPNMTPGERRAFLGRLDNLKEAVKTERGMAILWNQVHMMY